jgi:uncharacterized protein (DUF2336 family)
MVNGMQQIIQEELNESQAQGFSFIDDTNLSMVRTRGLLFRRLQDVVGLPSSRISPQERHMAADLLIEMLRDVDLQTRVRCSERISQLVDAHPLLLRFLSRNEIEVARPLLQVSNAFNDSDLIACAKSPTVSSEHRILIAQRKSVNEVVSDVLVEFGELDVCIALLRNEGARLANTAVETLTAMSKSYTELVTYLLKRPELRPSHGFTMFWWANSEDRRRILQRFAVERLTLLDAAQDIYARAAADNWQDALVRKSLQFIERRQRNRAAIEKSPFASLEAAVEAFEVDFNLDTIREISFLAGIKPACGAQIFTDPAGEPVAVLCKATGLKRRHLRMLWKGMDRPINDNPDEPDAFARASLVYDTLSINCAQTVLRYWNWSLTSAMSPILASQMEQDENLDFSTSMKTSRLVFGN